MPGRRPRVNTLCAGANHKTWARSSLGLRYVVATVPSYDASLDRRVAAVQSSASRAKPRSTRRAERRTGAAEAAPVVSGPGALAYFARIFSWFARIVS